MTASAKELLDRIMRELLELDKPCPDCREPVQMVYVCPINAGDDEGGNSEDLYQCPKCKTVKTW